MKGFSTSGMGFVAVTGEQNMSLCAGWDASTCVSAPEACRGSVSIHAAPESHLSIPGRPLECLLPKPPSPPKLTCGGTMLLPALLFGMAWALTNGSGISGQGFLVTRDSGSCSLLPRPWAGDGVSTWRHSGGGGSDPTSGRPGASHQPLSLPVPGLALSWSGRTGLCFIYNG